MPWTAGIALPYLARRPVHLPSSQQMHMEVVDGLASVRAGVDDETVALCQPLLPGDLGGRCEQMAEQLRVVGSGMRERGKVLPGDDEHVDGRLRVDVRE